MLSLALALGASCVLHGTNVKTVMISVDDKHVAQVHGQPGIVELSDVKVGGAWIDVDGDVRVSGRTTGPFWLSGLGSGGLGWFDRTEVRILAAVPQTDGRWKLDLGIDDEEVDGIVVACADIHYGAPPTVETPAPASMPAAIGDLYATTVDELVVHASADPSTPSVRVRVTRDLFPTAIRADSPQHGVQHVSVPFGCSGGAITGWVSAASLAPYPSPGCCGGGGPGCGDSEIGTPRAPPPSQAHLRAGALVQTPAGRTWATIVKAGEYLITDEFVGGPGFELYGPSVISPAPR
jgi:hypothetical protein